MSFYQHQINLHQLQ